jgi:hypothetical protein
MKEKTADFSASWVEMSNNENTSYYETIAAGSVVSTINLILTMLRNS